MKEAAKGRKKLHSLVPLTVSFFLLFEQKTPYFLFIRGHATYVVTPQWTMKRDRVGQRLGWKQSGLGHSPGGCKHVSKWSFWYQNPTLKHIRCILSHSELNPNFHYGSVPPIPPCLSPPAHLPPLISFHSSGRVILLTFPHLTDILPPQRLCTYHC